MNAHLKEMQLKNAWKLWGHLPKESDWTKNSYIKIAEIRSVLDAVGIIEMIPHDLIKSFMLFVMKNDIYPMWEDDKNKNGGCFSYKISNKHVVDVWKELCYVLFGETISKNQTFVNCVTGITISPKKNFCIVKIWTSVCDYQNPQIVTDEIKNLVPAGCLFKKHSKDH